MSTTPRYPKTPGQVKQGVFCADFYEKAAFAACDRTAHNGMRTCVS